MTEQTARANVRTVPWKCTACLIALSAVLTVPSLNRQCFGAMYVLTSVDTAFLDNQQQPDINLTPLYGAIGVYHYLDHEQRSLLKFNLPTIAPSEAITSVTLAMSMSNASQFTSQHVPIDIRGVADDSWQTGTITWANQPAIGTFLSTLSFNPDDPGSPLRPFGFAWELSVQNLQADAQDGILSLALVMPISDVGGVGFSLAAEVREPILIVTTGTVPEPSSLVLFVCGLLMIASKQFHLRQTSSLLTAVENGGAGRPNLVALGK